MKGIMVKHAKPSSWVDPETNQAMIDIVIDGEEDSVNLRLTAEKAAILANSLKALT